MSRFSNLEFDETPPGGARVVEPAQWQAQLTGTPTRDGGYFRDAADTEFRIENYESALRAYARALEQDRTLYEAWLGQVRTLLETGEFKEAELWANKALELFPEQPELLATKAIAIARTGRLKSALTASDRAVAQRGATAFVWLARAEVLMATGRPMADHCLDKALLLCADSAARGWMQWEIARLRRKYSQFGQALKHIRSAMEILPDEPAVWLELARCQIALCIPAARESLRQAVQLAPECSVARRLLGTYRKPGLLCLFLSLFRKRH